MRILTLDFETYYCSKSRYSLRNMGMEGYILDQRFQVHGVSVSLNGEPSRFLSHREAKAYFAGFDWNTTTVVGHNLAFDAAILCWRYGRMAAFYVDGLGIANAFVRPYTGRSDLDSCARFLGLPQKSGVLKQVNGLRTEEIIAAGLYDTLGAYANQDNDNCKHIMLKYFPQMLAEEKWKLDWSVRNYLRGRLTIDLQALKVALGNTLLERDKLLAEAGLTDPSLLRSTKKFASYLELLGVEVEYKDGKTGEIPAVGKDDPFVRELLAHPDPNVVAAIKARLAFSSSIEVTRAQRLVNMCEATRGKMLIPYRYHAAHTGRPGGTDGVNVTNFKRNSPIRKAIKTKPEHVLVEVDASQIEARLACWLAACMPLYDAFAAGTDVYCMYGSTVLYGFPINKQDHPIERQVCKVEVLSLQYGVGRVTLHKRLQAENIAITLDEAASHVKLYRSSYPEMLTNGAEFCLNLRHAVSSNLEIEWKGFLLTPRGIILPSGRWMLYPELCVSQNELMYYSHRYKSWQKLYPGSMNENLCQAMANDIVGAALVKYKEDTLFFTYDSISRLVRVEDADRAAEETLAAMRTPPAWARNVSLLPLPLDAEPKFKTNI
jgi:hypothetical protein